jgi:hypothetical protein
VQECEGAVNLTFLRKFTATTVHAGTKQQLQAVVRQQPMPAYQALELAVRGSPVAERQQCARLLLSTLELFYAVERRGKTVVRGSEQHVLPINLQFSFVSFAASRWPLHLCRLRAVHPLAAAAATWLVLLLS